MQTATCMHRRLIAIGLTFTSKTAACRAPFSGRVTISDKPSRMSVWVVYTLHEALHLTAAAGKRRDGGL